MIYINYLSSITGRTYLPSQFKKGESQNRSEISEELKITFGDKIKKFSKNYKTAYIFQKKKK